jgi:hypothetical protein
MLPSAKAVEHPSTSDWSPIRTVDLRRERTLAWWAEPLYIEERNLATEALIMRMCDSSGTPSMSLDHKKLNRVCFPSALPRNGMRRVFASCTHSRLSSRFPRVRR